MKIKFYDSILARTSTGILSFIFLILVFTGCKEEVNESLWPGNIDPGATPVITSVNPPTESLAGIDVIEIIGTSFSNVASENLVYFGSAKATVLEASSTRLLVRAPNNPKDSLQLKVATLFADLYSEPVQYKLRPAVEEIAKQTGRKLYAPAIDAEGNIYSSITAAGAGAGIWKFISDGTSGANFAPKGGETFFNNLKVGPENNIYGARAVKAIFEVKEGVAAAAWKTGVENITDFDFDKNKNIWAGSNSTKNELYFINYADKTHKIFTYEGTVINLRVFGDALYILSKSGTSTKVSKLPLLGTDEVGTAEVYFDVTASYPNITPSCLAIAFDGTLYIGNSDTSSTAPPIIQVNADKSHSVFFESIVGDKIFACPVLAFTWGIADDLYYVRGEKKSGAGEDATVLQTHELIKVIAKKQSAPYYGRGDL